MRPQTIESTAKTGTIRPVTRVLALFMAFVVVFGVAAMAAALGWREGMSRRPRPDHEAAVNVLIGPACGLIGSLVYVVAALFVLALLTIAVTVLRRRRQPGEEA